MIPGIKMKLNDADYILAPIALTPLRLMWGDIVACQKGERDPLQFMETTAALLHYSLVRNYPDSTIEKAGDLIDISNFVDVFTSIMDVTGARRKEQEMGEAKPGN